jgi:hypothetical protein
VPIVLYGSLPESSSQKFNGAGPHFLDSSNIREGHSVPLVDTLAYGIAANALHPKIATICSFDVVRGCGWALPFASRIYLFVFERRHEAGESCVE